MFESLLQDIRYGTRMLVKSPGFTITAILTLAIGIGATTAIFSQVNAIFWRKLPVNHPEQLRTMVWTSPKRGFVGGTQVNPGPKLPVIGETFSSYSYPVYKAMRDGTMKSFSDLAMWTDVSDIRPVVMGELGFGSVHFVSGNYFRTLGVSSIIGRTIQPEDDQEGSTSAVAVISYRFWQAVWRGDAAGFTRSADETRAAAQHAADLFRIVRLAALFARHLWPPVLCRPMQCPGERRRSVFTWPWVRSVRPWSK